MRPWGLRHMIGLQRLSKLPHTSKGITAVHGTCVSNKPQFLFSPLPTVAPQPAFRKCKGRNTISWTDSWQLLELPGLGYTTRSSCKAFSLCKGLCPWQKGITYHLRLETGTCTLHNTWEQIAHLFPQSYPQLPPSPLCAPLRPSSAAIPAAWGLGLGSRQR